MGSTTYNRDGEYLYRLYRRGDEEKIVDLLLTVFPSWPSFSINVSPLEHWAWKYLDNQFRTNFSLTP